MENQAAFIALLRRYNPWWRGGGVPDLPAWRRQAFADVHAWMTQPPTHRALLISGARQIGKTTLMLQVVQGLLDGGVSPNKILYATFDHPLLKQLGLEGLISLWHEFEPESEAIEYLFLDEIQGVDHWQVWLKHQTDFEKRRRIAVTGSATPLLTEGQESGVGRWHTLPLATLSFFEYLQLKGIEPPPLPPVPSLADLAHWTPVKCQAVAADAAPLVAHFHDYLLRGGFPQSALIPSVTLAQRLLREDLVDKVLMRDMTALFGVRQVSGLEQLFLYLCLHGGGLLDVQSLCVNLGLKRPTVLSYLDLLARTHLLHKVAPLGYGKDVLRARYKVYLADPAIAPSVMLKGDTLLEDDAALGLAVETAAFKHLHDHYPALHYWHGKRGHEVDFVAESAGRLVAFEVKYRQRSKTGASELKGLRELGQERGGSAAYILTRDLADFGPMTLDGFDQVLKIPAALACYWLSSPAGEA